MAFDVYVRWLAPDVLSAPVLGLSAGVVVVVTLLATQLAARRALRIGPVEALRSGSAHGSEAGRR